MSPSPLPGDGELTEISSELESFRNQWRAEVRDRASGGPSMQSERSSHGLPRSSAGDHPAESSSRTQAAARPSARKRILETISAGKKPLVAAEEDEYDYVQTRSFDEPPLAEHGDAAAAPEAEPVSALEYYEQAVKREEQGSLGDSLRLYRKAYRMDSAVDKKYRNKHFPPPASGVVKPIQTAETRGGLVPDKPLPIADLIASFAGLSVEPAPAAVEGMPEPPCPLAALPDEILVHILGDVAVADVGDFVRLARVCKKLAYLVAREEQIWRRVCVEEASPFGFVGLHRTWQTTIEGKVLGARGALGGGDLSSGQNEDEDEDEEYEKGLELGWSEKEIRHARETEERRAALATAVALRLEGSYASWQRMFRARPRLRFHGCYISTVNYTRQGQASVNLVTWNSPVHIVTYFRYLRFFRNGTCISLLTTTEPTDVVHHLTLELLTLHRDGGMAHLPSSVMQYALRGRWRMSGGSSAEDGSRAGQLDEKVAVAAESDVVVETEGVGKYYNRMELTLQTAGKGARNNKLNWRGFYSYNRLTDDWGEFALRNDKPFFFSRVRSYGAGE